MYKILLILSLFIFSCDEEPDCAGVPGGSAKEDDCGICSGGTTGLVANVSKDCRGECNGVSIEDCDGVCGGSASLDDCGICTNGTTGLIANFLKDCAGECNGSSVEDCNGECAGSASIDDCGLCTAWKVGNADWAFIKDKENSIGIIFLSISNITNYYSKILD